MTDLQYSFRVGKQTISDCIRDVCWAIWTILHNEEIPTPSEVGWNKIVEKFNENANFPNCLGAIDGKHIRVIKPKHSGSLYHNYKHYFSIVLLAVCDSDYLFTYVDIGSYGKECDSNIFKQSTFYKSIQNNTLNTPPDKCLPGQNEALPHMFVGDEAFGLSSSVLRPYAGNYLQPKKRIFNYRLSRARRYVECTFGILSNKWRIFHTPMNVGLNAAIDITKACCVLHNFVRRRDGFNREDTAIRGNVQGIAPVPPCGAARGGRAANNIRDNFADYFTSYQGSVSWQNEMI